MTNHKTVFRRIIGGLALLSVTLTFMGVGSFGSDNTVSAAGNQMFINNLRYTSTDKKVKLKWDKIPSADGFEIRKDSVDHFLDKFKTIRKNVTGFTDGDVFSGVTYEYGVRAYRKSKGKKVYSPWLNIWVKVKAGKEAVLTDKMEKMILSDADSRRKSISESKTDIVRSDEFIKGKTYTGTAYYISNSGSDQNPGTSPEQALATAKGLEKAEIKYGDAVFFERGGIWRGEDIMLPYNVCFVPGVTFSAYGSGEKPRIYGSEENGAGSDKWELYYQDGSKKIWKYHKEMTDVGAINADGQVLRRDLAWWDGSEYHVVGGKAWCNHKATEKKYDLKEELPDLYFFPMLLYPKENWENTDGRIFINDDVHVRGSLYMRCDRGNPGEIFNSIEFIQTYFFNDGFADDQVFDNLNISYSGFTFTSGVSDDRRASGDVFQNCEVGWHGGVVLQYERSYDKAKKSWAFMREGGCIAINGSDMLVRNNYVHHAYQEGINIETFEGDKTVSNVMITGNLLEYCLQGLFLITWETKDKNHIFKDCTFSDNYALYSGYEDLCWKSEKTGFPSGFAFGFLGEVCRYENLRVKNNVFAFCNATCEDNALISVDKDGDYSKAFSGNTYIQNKGHNIARRNASTLELCLGKMSMTKRNIEKLLGDKTAKVYVKKS